MLQIFGFLITILFSSSVLADAVSSDTDVLKKQSQEKPEHDTKPKAKKEEAPVIKTEHRIHRTETININHNMRPELIKDAKTFCSNSKAQCKKDCESWLKEQKKSLGKRLRTSYCSNAQDLYGEEKEGCMNVFCKGELSYEMR